MLYVGWIAVCARTRVAPACTQARARTRVEVEMEEEEEEEEEEEKRKKRGREERINLRENRKDWRRFFIIEESKRPVRRSDVHRYRRRRRRRRCLRRRRRRRCMCSPFKLLNGAPFRGS